MLGNAIREARRKRGWSQPRLAEEAGKLPGAPLISLRSIAVMERGRMIVHLEDPQEPLPYVLRALGLGGEPVLRALGLAA